jgi:hypothetical protein
VPIANCFVHDELPAELESDALTALWSEESGMGSEQMTINIIAGMRQYGAPYRGDGVSVSPLALEFRAAAGTQTELVRALGRGFGLAPAEVQVITSIVESGQVVEGGETQDWYCWRLVVTVPETVEADAAELAPTLAAP